MRRWGRKNATDWLSARLAKGALTAFMAVALAGTVLVAPAGAALVTRPVWKIQISPNATTTGGQLASVSCSAPDACTAVGTAGNTQGLPVTLAERWNGTSWQRQSTPQPGRTIPDSHPGLSGVSCPTSAFCEAVGTNQIIGRGIGLAYGWNGSTWERQTFRGPLGSTSVSRCLARRPGSVRRWVSTRTARTASWLSPRSGTEPRGGCSASLPRPAAGKS